MAVLQLWVNIPKVLLYNVHGLLLLLIPSLLAGQWCCRELADRRRRKPRDNTVDSLVQLSAGWPVMLGLGTGGRAANTGTPGYMDFGTLG